MQALCAPTENSADVKCPICSKGFRLFWERTSKPDQLAALPEILKHLRAHHDEGTEHPETAFNVPSWSGNPEFSGAALLGGAY
ncbi:MAG: hypothetical protein PW789_08785 [Edaphobacter sp.]|uniref:hypothetical protein n=1 Tax=Edaphobacter sp. TaxID=1934404 RepID=UPI00239D828C|nr:hypothetical protein [Edaphobacter sp.]MDE1176691.1 hypothetical protein [Edaphobacter sp.]